MVSLKVKDATRTFRPVSARAILIIGKSHAQTRALIDEILQVFNRTSAQYNYSVTVDLFEDDIPVDLFSNKMVSSLYLKCNSSNILLRADENAFRSSRNYLGSFRLGNCNLLRMSSKFLEGFDQLRNLYFIGISNLQTALATLPTLPNLYQLQMSGCSNDFVADFEYDSSSILSPTLTILNAHSNNWNEIAMGWTLGWISKRNSTDKLLDVNLNGNAMSRIPSELGSISKFRNLWIVDNAVPMIVVSGSLNFEYPTTSFGNVFRYVNIVRSNVVDIQPGAFQGNFSWPTHIFLDENHLTRFEEDVFFPVFEEFDKADVSNYFEIFESMLG